MEARVQVISREMIKPSRKTPHHLKNMRLSYLDQSTPAIYFPILFFYRADESKGLTTSNHVRISQRMKRSICDTLTSFYPLAGRIQDNFVVNCNNAGVVFVHARSGARIVDVVHESNMEEKHLKQYIPCSDRYHSTCISNRPLFLVQVTCFDCGGIAVGVSFLHKIADLASVMAFMGAWAGACRGEGGDEVSREKLRALKEAAINPSGSTTVKNPTRIELVSSFIWKHLIDFSKHKNGAKRRIVVGASHAANLRPRKNILENMFGNCIIISSAFTDSANANELQELVGKLRRCIRKINDDYITESQSGDRALNDLQELVTQLITSTKVEEEEEDEQGLLLEWCCFTSWCRFPLYEVDYGWGRPLWVCTTALPLKNLIVLMNTKSREGIEAWANLNKDNLNLLETKIQLISITNIN
ncbi:hypothetical protein MIMGU_mgv1a019422mg [Erythranthe guttata]|uniref:Vinorine synthase-like n=1 Tax=Erythranthe guttata TaxID=4155 RepID=A0A022RDW8_ERYGU|nr:hypothetical protein MIMGU_mgv1a019422mg [Erythranthe guttata]